MKVEPGRPSHDQGQPSIRTVLLRLFICPRHVALPLSAATYASSHLEAGHAETALMQIMAQEWSGRRYEASLSAVVESQGARLRAGSAGLLRR
jgi:hypothetical protein